MSAETDRGGTSAQRAAEEEQLAAMTSTDMILQAAVLLLNVGGRRLGLAPPSASAEELAAARADRDLDQVRDAIDAVRALVGVLERTLSEELRPLRDALSQLQIAYAREVQSAGAPGAGAAAGEQAESAKAGETPAAEASEGEQRPGPAEASGRLWVPGR
jgi:ABC-type transporter Mla subunit MlaD